jgi:O-antigen/teichoic acid export membrane protein
MQNTENEPSDTSVRSLSDQARSMWAGVRSVSLVSSGSAATAVEALLVTYVATRVLGSSEYGHFVFALAAVAWLGALFDLGVSVKAVTAFDATRGRWNPVTLATYHGAEWVSSAVGVTVLAIGIAVGLIPTNLSPAAVAAALVATVASGLALFYSALLQAMQRWRSRTRATVVGTSLRNAAALAGLTAGTVGWGVAGYAVGSVLSLIPFRREFVDIPERLKPNFDPRKIVKLWSESRWFLAACVIGATTAFVPLGRLAAGTDASARLSVYGLAFTLAGGTQLLLDSVQLVLLPQGSSRNIPVRGYLSSAARSAAPVLLIFAIGAALTPWLLPLVFGSSFSGAVAPLELLLASDALLLHANPIQFLLYRVNGARIITAIDLVNTVAVVAGLAIVHSPSSTAVAAVILAATATSRAVGLAAVFRLRRRITND